MPNRELRQQREIGFEEVHRILTKAFQRDFVKIPVNNDDAKRAAVMCILYPKHRQPYLLLTRRKSTLFDHAGEISFPGGSKEDRDNNLLETALREVEEELGLTLSYTDVIGELSAVFTYSSNFVISPFLAVVKTSPSVKSISAEVSYVLEVDFNRFMDQSNYGEDNRTFAGKTYSVPYYDYEGNIIWGATAQIINQLVKITSEPALTY
ncbi:MAG: CoA pyrophosphatase [Thaumarchaeota archaeon]|nr:CoA pyrophosphatase [Nitrososphaerota archaeon]